MSLYVTLRVNDDLPLGVIQIHNTGTGDEHKADYEVTIFDEYGVALKTVEVTDYPRGLGPWTLMANAIEKLDVHSMQPGPGWRPGWRPE